MTARAVLWTLVRSCHPEPTAAVTLLSTAYAALGGAGRRAPLVGAAVLAQQLSIGWSNDALDAVRDRADARTDKPLVAGALSPRTVLGAAVAALAASVPLSLAAGRGARGGGAGNLVCAVSGWAYNVALKATPASPLPYLAGFGGLAAFLDTARPGVDRASAWVVAGGALLGATAHFANVLPDIDDDLAHGIAGLPQRLGAARSRQAGAALLAAAGAVLGAAPDQGRGSDRRDEVTDRGSAGRPAPRVLSARPARSGRVRAASAAALAVPAAVLAVVSGRAGPGSRVAFRLVLVVAVADVGLFLGRARR